MAALVGKWGGTIKLSSKGIEINLKGVDKPFMDGVTGPKLAKMIAENGQVLICNDQIMVINDPDMVQFISAQETTEFFPGMRFSHICYRNFLDDPAFEQQCS